MKVAPSLLSADFARLDRELQSVGTAGADWLHLDVMDGVFVPNITFGTPVIRSLRRESNIFFDVHLMIVEPERYVGMFASAGADLITIHAEACRDLEAALRSIRSLGKKAGLSIKPDTPSQTVYPYLELCDVVLIMTVEPGFGGQSLIPETVEKIRELRHEIDRRGCGTVIEADGGINISNAADISAAGCDVAVAGSAFFGAADRASVVRAIRG